jgi:UDP-N-acetylmuramoyl-L-alanyl-D-glutamate--2,6-diaminopimelate ligase
MEPVKLKVLFENIEGLTWKGGKEMAITSITANSKTVSPGALFIAKRGKTGDGHRFIPDAVAAGAAALLTDTYDPFLALPQIIHPDVNSLELILAKRFYHNPASQLFLVGVTGTSGKTTVAFLVQHFLQPCGLIGTVTWMTGNKVFPATHTTPDLLTVTHLLRDMVACGTSSAVMEISSHSLDQKRVAGISLNIGIFTNLSHDHLDYHPSMEAYARAKAELFAALAPESVAIVNGDDPWSPFMLRACKAKVLRYGMHETCDLKASQLKLSSSGMEFLVEWRGEKHLFTTSLIGRFNIYNILAATSAALCHNHTLAEIANKLDQFLGVPGRLERVPNRRNLQVFVDYAHKPAALHNVLETLREIKQGKLITVFGCGGQRDTAKRPQMAAIAEKLSDFTIITSDNPRNEDPVDIAHQIMSGFQNRSSYTVELDRKKAIALAMREAKPEDIVLIAGKGHETYQIFAGHTIPFDDRQIVQDMPIC